jgi:hypothetical protein
LGIRFTGSKISDSIQVRCRMNEHQPRLMGGLQMRTRVLAVGLLLATLAAGAGAAPQTAGLGTVGGSVLGPNGQAIEGARVTLQSSDGTRPETTVTNAEGRFWFPMLPKGLYDVRAYSKGRASEWRKNVWVEPGRQNTVALRLQSKKPAPKTLPASVYFH